MRRREVKAARKSESKIKARILKNNMENRYVVNLNLTNLAIQSKRQVTWFKQKVYPILNFYFIDTKQSCQNYPST